MAQKKIQNKTKETRDTIRCKEGKFDESSTRSDGIASASVPLSSFRTDDQSGSDEPDEERERAQLLAGVEAGDASALLEVGLAYMIGDYGLERNEPLGSNMFSLLPRRVIQAVC